MKMEIVKVTVENLAESVIDPNLHVIKKHCLWDGYEIKQIGSVSVNDILNKANLVVRITDK